MNKNWALSMEIEANRFSSSNEAPAADPPLEVETLSVPLSLLYFDERGFFGSLGVTYVNQDVVRSKRTMDFERMQRAMKALQLSISDLATVYQKGAGSSVLKLGTF